MFELIYTNFDGSWVREVLERVDEVEKASRGASAGTEARLG